MGKVGWKLEIPTKFWSENLKTAPRKSNYKWQDNIEKNLGDDHVDGVRLRPLTAATCDPIANPPGDTCP
jgi:hypothetical protein